MMRGYRTRAFASLMTALFVVLLLCSRAVAGTTGSISGHVVDFASGAPIADAKVSVISPSQSVAGTTDASGSYAFISLSPDTYTVSAQKTGYDLTSLPGITVQANQTHSLTIVLKKSVAVLGTVKVVGSQIGLVKAGVTSNVYSVSGAAGQAATALGGTGNLNTAYSQMASVPGVSAVQGQQGWYQPIYIRGGDLDQVGWEFDGIPVNRTYDNAPQTFLSNLGQQELQVYTGGTSANADASGIAGYVNQVIKRGTSPGFGTLDLGIGGPAFYNKASLELGGASPDQRFSYYVGTSVADQAYRYIDQSNGATFINQGYFFPINTTYFGASANTFTTGNAYGIADTQDHENVANFHMRVGVDDDVQLLYMTSYLFMDYYSSQNDLGGTAFLLNSGAAVNFSDAFVYNGPIFAAPNAANVVPYLFASTPHTFGAFIPQNVRDTNSNADTITKLQYQHNFSSKSYFRIFGFSDYSNWFIHGPESQALFCCYGAELADYELPSHQYGGVADFSSQLNDKNLITISGLYETTRTQRYTTTGSFPGSNPAITSDVLNGDCFDPVNGEQVFCVAPNHIPTYRGPYDDSFGNQVQGTAVPTGGPCVVSPLTVCETPKTGQWIVTENGYRANFNRVNPVFTALAINDTITPSDSVTFNIGARVENYRINLIDDAANPLVYPARAFWFHAYNNEFCFGPGYFYPLQKTTSPKDKCADDWPLTTAIDEVNQNPGSFSHTEFQPRFGVSYEANSDNVFRFSAGVYSRPASTREASWNVVEQNLPAFLGINFAVYGQFTPHHEVRPDRSTNFDASWEHHFPGTQASLKVTPFYRSTQDQVQQTVVNSLSGLFASFNTGRQVSDGVELAIQEGSFSQNGWAFNLAYTYTHSQIKYNSFSNGRNVIDNMNSYVQLYNSYTSACAGATPSSSPTSLCGVFGDQTTSVSPDPYLSAQPQPLFDRSAWYTPYDLIPVPWAAGNGYEVPSTATLLVNYKSGPLSITPSFIYSSGSTYGSPLSWNDDISGVSHSTIFPSALAGNPLMTPDPYTGKFDNFGDFKQPSRFTMNLALGYQMSARVHTVLTISNIIDRCAQRGYVWDYTHVCSYSTLPSSFLTPTGGSAANAAANGPIQLRYPYAMWLNNNNTGFVGVTLPVQASLDVQFKL